VILVRVGRCVRGTGYGDGIVISDEAIVKKVQAAIEAESRFDIRTLHLELKDDQLLLGGDVGNIAAKRIAVRVAQGIDGVRNVVDELCVVPGELRSDREILDTFAQLVQGQIEFRNCALSRKVGEQVEVLHQTQDDDRCGDIVLSATNGMIILEGFVISLSHKRMAEVLAWWVPGCRNVINHLAIVPAEGDSDDEVSDAVRLALEMDPLVAHADQINLFTNHGVVTLQGVIASEEERHMAEFDAWCVQGVSGVENRLEVMR
jgi:osmotically-inducible protein OsmY